MYLNCHSYHSLRYGTLSVLELIAQAKANQLEYLALTDINCSTAVFDFSRACEAENIKPIVGIEFRENDTVQFIGLAKNARGLAELNHFLSERHLNNEPIPKACPAFEHCYVIYPLSNIPKTLRANEYLGVQHYEITKLIGKPILRGIDRMVALHTVTHSGGETFMLHKLLRSIHHNILLSKLQPKQHGTEHAKMLPIPEISDHFQLLPRLMVNTEKLAQNCHFNFDYKAPKNKKHYTGTAEDDKRLLEQLTFQGLKKRYGPDNKVAEQRLIRELEIINQLGFSCYFLTTWDIIRYSLSQGYYHVGRGSGANSIAAYCLYITDVDPIELNLYFERFLNPSRTSPPDFDIDWSWKHRDDILDYIYKRFGAKNTAFCGTTGTFKKRSIIRELGKVFGLPKSEMDDLTRTAKEHHDKNEIVKAIHHYGDMLTGFPNLRSMHSCGILITEAPITDYTVLEMMPKGYPTAQIDMYVAESIGIEKLDILSQRGLGHISDSVKIILENQGVQIDIHQTELFKRDQRCNTMLGKGLTIGCFYIESPAMRGLLRRLNCNDYGTLVAASSIIRPGVAKSGMMREYVVRHNHPEQTKYFHPVFKEQLGDTYGVMVYQEDVIKIAHHFAGLGLDEADILRRGMSGKTRSKKEMELVKQKFFDNCKSFGYDDRVTNEVYRQIESFAGYSFCKSHSASYAVESYQSLYLKAYYPIEFMVAVINNFGGFYRTEVYVHEARMAGAIIQPPSVNEGDYLTTVSGKVVILGFNLVQNLPQKLAERIAPERVQNGQFTDLENFIKRTQATLDEVETLIYIGAFRFLNASKGALIIEARKLLSSPANLTNEPLLFYAKSKPWTLPELEYSSLDDAFDEIEGIGFPVAITFFDLLRTKYRGDVMVADLPNYNEKVVKMVGYLISRKDVPTNKGLMNFGTFIDYQGQYFDTTHFPDILKRYPFKGSGCYLLLGRVVVDFNFPSIEIMKMEKLPLLPDPRYSDKDNSNYDAFKNVKEDHSKTQRAPYPTKKEVDKAFGK
ncbi:MAG: DNA polymerase III subunit alpha [Putridiphycobacter sp.]|nr:DNA polymerase III subunit alpha [Putridiphycobacter sp.]